MTTYFYLQCRPQTDRVYRVVDMGVLRSPPLLNKPRYVTNRHLPARYHPLGEIYFPASSTRSRRFVVLWCTYPSRYPTWPTQHCTHHSTHMSSTNVNVNLFHEDPTAETTDLLSAKIVWMRPTNVDVPDNVQQILSKGTAIRKMKKTK